MLARLQQSKLFLPGLLVIAAAIAVPFVFTGIAAWLAGLIGVVGAVLGMMVIVVGVAGGSSVGNLRELVRTAGRGERITRPPQLPPEAGEIYDAIDSLSDEARRRDERGLELKAEIAKLQDALDEERKRAQTASVELTKTRGEAEKARAESEQVRSLVLEAERLIGEAVTRLNQGIADQQAAVEQTATS